MFDQRLFLLDTQGKEQHTDNGSQAEETGQQEIPDQ
jgi:hypothetical protein